MLLNQGSYVKLSPTLYYGIHPRLVKPFTIPVINHYVSLVEDHEIPGGVESASQTYHRFPIKDRKAPSLEYLTRIIDFIERLDGVVYLFCKGGHGRSGTIASVLYGKSHNLQGKEAMTHVNKEWHNQRDLTRIRPKIVKLGSPQTACQKRVVKEYLLK